MPSKFSSSEWSKINSLYQSSASDFGLPERRSKSVVIGTFNIRKLGRVAGRSTQSWNLLKDIVKRKIPCFKFFQYFPNFFSFK